MKKFFSPLLKALLFSTNLFISANGMIVVRKPTNEFYKQAYTILTSKTSKNAPGEELKTLYKSVTLLKLLIKNKAVEDTNGMIENLIQTLNDQQTLLNKIFLPTLSKLWVAKLSAEQKKTIGKKLLKLAEEKLIEKN